MKSFDLAEVEQDDTAVIKLVHPSTGDEIGATITVYGQDSATFKRETFKLSNKCVEYSRRNRGKSIPNEDYAELDKKKVVACVKSVDNLIYKGEPLTDAEEIFTKFPWIHEQAVAGIMDRSLFIKDSSTK